MLHGTAATALGEAPELVRFLVAAAAVQPLVVHLCLVVLAGQILLEPLLVVVEVVLLRQTQTDLTVRSAE
jgi:hypothetical protein